MSDLALGKGGRHWVAEGRTLNRSVTQGSSLHAARLSKDYDDMVSSIWRSVHDAAKQAVFAVAACFFVCALRPSDRPAVLVDLVDGDDSPVAQCTMNPPAQTLVMLPEIRPAGSKDTCTCYATSVCESRQSGVEYGLRTRLQPWPD